MNTTRPNGDELARRDAVVRNWQRQHARRAWITAATYADPIEHHRAEHRALPYVWAGVAVVVLVLLSYLF